MPNLEKIFVQQSGSVKEWWSDVSKPGIWGFIIPKASITLKKEKGPFLSVEAMPLNQSVMLMIDVLGDFLTVDAKLTEDNNLDFSPHSFQPRNGMSPNETAEFWAAAVDEILGKELQSPRIDLSTHK